MQIKLNVDFQEALGATKNDATRRGGKGYPKLVTKSVLTGSRVHAISKSPPKNMYKIKEDLALYLFSI